jgi:hypothetical protein
MGMSFEELVMRDGAKEDAFFHVSVSRSSFFKITPIPVGAWWGFCAYKWKQ